MINLDQIIAAADALEPLPATTARLVQLVGTAHVELDEIAELIAFDQAMTLALLRAANSAFSASAEPVATVKDAVSRMGTGEVLHLAAAFGLRPFLQARLPAYGLGEGALWRHSVAAAVAAQTLPDFCDVILPPEGFTAAMLHDVGKLVMGRFLSPEILAFMQRAQETDQLDRTAAEAQLFKIHHGQLGGQIAKNWRMPPRVVLGITHHHEPGPGADVICDLTYLANHVAKRIEAGLYGGKFQAPIDPEALARLGLTVEKLELHFPVAAARYAKVSSGYNVKAAR
jgi:HD-like signal output (HDOD) protein